MKTSSTISSRHRTGFTLPEMMIAVTIFIFVVGGILSAHMWGLRMFQFDQRKLNATDWSRRTFGKITEEIHECSTVQVGNIVNNVVGNVTNAVFQGLLDGETQQGSALLIYPTANSTSFILYFVNAADQTLRRTDTNGATMVLADSLTNALFTAQDYQGNVLTYNENNRVIHISLGFYQPESFQVAADSYKLETSVTRRALQ